MAFEPAAETETASTPEPSLRDAIKAEYSKAADTPEPDVAVATVPETETAAEAAARARDDKGRFAPKVDGKEAAPAVQTAPQPNAESSPATPATTTVSGPPGGWSVAAKAAYDTLPDPVKSAIAEREVQINNGLSKLRDYKDLDPYAEMARNSGTTLGKAFEAYTAAEQYLEREPIPALLMLAQTYKVDPRQLISALGGQVPQQAQGQPYQGQQAPQTNEQFVALQRRQDMLESHIKEQQTAAKMSEIDSFFNDPSNRYASNVADQMAILIQKGIAPSLKDAYERATWANPEIRALLIKEQSAVAQKPTADQNVVAKQKAAALSARAAGKGINGAPATTTPPASSSNGNLRDQIKAAFYGDRA